jgi:hypothetical protein
MPYLSRVVVSIFFAAFFWVWEAYGTSPAAQGRVMCNIGLAEIDKSSSLGIGGETQALKIELDKENSNYTGYGTAVFKKNPFKVSIMVTVGESNMKNTWSSIGVTLYKSQRGKNQLRGAILVPNTYYSPGVIAPQEIYVGDSTALNKVSNVPGALEFKSWDVRKLVSSFNDGEVIGAMVSCYPD